MKNITNKMVLAAAFAAAVVPALSAQAGKAAPAKKAPVKAEAPAKKAPAKPAPTLESVLSFLPDVLAEVGSKKLTKKEFIAQLASSQIAPQMLAQIPSEMLKGMLVQQINQMVNQMIIMELAEKAGYKPSADAVKKALDKMYNQMPAQQKAQVDSGLKAQGKSYKAYRDEVAKDPKAQEMFAAQNYIQDIQDKLKATVTDKDAEKFYRENQNMFAKPGIVVSHILAKSMATDDNGKPLSAEALKKQDAAAKKKIDGIYAKLKQGAKFEDLAKESDCPSGMQSAGKLPAFDENGRMEGGGGYEPTFVKAALKLKKAKEISAPVKTPFGYHIIRLEEKKPASFVPFNDVKEGLKAQLLNQKMSAEMQKRIAQGKKDIKVKVNVKAPAMPAAM